MLFVIVLLPLIACSALLAGEARDNGMRDF